MMRRMLFLSVFVFACGMHASALDDSALKPLVATIENAKDAAAVYAPFEQLKEAYFKEKRFADFAALARSLGERQSLAGSMSAYYCSLGRYLQLKYLEESQSWDEYFARGNEYREELVSCGSRAASSQNPADPARLGARLVLWRFHRDQQDTFEEDALTDLISAAEEFTGQGAEAGLLKEAADALAAYGERGKAKQLYRLYVSRLVLTQTDNDSLLATADGFMREGDIELAEGLYDIYLEKTSTPELRPASIPTLIAVAAAFAGETGTMRDPFYAEKLFGVVADAAGEAAFDDESLILRASNLERMGEFSRAGGIYEAFLARSPGSAHAGSIIFKLGIIAAFVDRDLGKARDYFTKASAGEAAGAEGSSSLYYLGLLSQWESDTAKAKEYYAALLARSGDASTLKGLAQARLKEIEEAAPLAYAQKSFLDASLGPDALPFGPSKVVLQVALPSVAAGEDAQLNAMAQAGESGCMQVAMSYLWSGDALGQGDGPDVALTCAEPGTKVVSLAVVSAGGIVDRTFAFIDVR